MSQICYLQRILRACGSHCSLCNCVASVPFTLFLRTIFQRARKLMLSILVFFFSLCLGKALLLAPWLWSCRRAGTCVVESCWVPGPSQSQFGEGLCGRPHTWCPIGKQWPQAPAPLCHLSTWSQRAKSKCGFSSGVVKSPPQLPKH